MTKRLKVLYIIDLIRGDLGGTESQLIKLINGFDNKFIRVSLICFDNTEWFQFSSSIFKCNSRVIEIAKFKKPSTYINFIRLIKFIQNYDPDIVHTFFPVGNIIGVLAAKLAGVRNIVSSRRDYGEWMNKRYLAATIFANKYVKKIIANSHAVRELTERKEHEYDGKVDVIYNGIDLDKFMNITRDYNLKKQLLIPDSNKVVGIIANFRPMKNHYAFIKAAREISSIRDDVSFILVGGTGDTLFLMNKVKAYGVELNIKDKLYFVGPQKNVIPFLALMDIGVNCSEMEGLSNAVMEYMAGRTPCIVSQAGGNPDLITHNVNGYTFKLNDYKTLATLILKLLDDEETRSIFIKRSHEKVKKQMSLETMLHNYGNMYLKLVTST